MFLLTGPPLRATILRGMKAIGDLRFHQVRAQVIPCCSTSVLCFELGRELTAVQI